MSLTTRTTYYQQLLITLLMMLFPIFSYADSTSISNSVSVSASNGESKAVIKSVINGETVTDITIESDDPIEYQETVHASNGQTTLSAKTNSTQLAQLISHLQTLIKLYETILEQQK